MLGTQTVKNDDPAFNNNSGKTGNANSRNIKSVYPSAPRPQQQPLHTVTSQSTLQNRAQRYAAFAAQQQAAAVAQPVQTQTLNVPAGGGSVCWNNTEKLALVKQLALGETRQPQVNTPTTIAAPSSVRQTPTQATTSTTTPQAAPLQVRQTSRKVNRATSSARNAPRERIVPPKLIGADEIKQIKFSQTTISSFNEKTHESLEELEAKMKKGFNVEGALDLVDMGGGKLVSVDNRRLYCARNILRTNTDYKIYVKVHGFNDPFPFQDRNRLEGERSKFQKNWNHSFAENYFNGEVGSWGEFVQTRIGNQNDRAFQERLPTGYPSHLVRVID